MRKRLKKKEIAKFEEQKSAQECENKGERVFEASEAGRDDTGAAGQRRAGGKGEGTVCRSKVTTNITTRGNELSSIYLLAIRTGA